MLASTVDGTKHQSRVFEYQCSWIAVSTVILLSELIEKSIKSESLASGSLDY